MFISGKEDKEYLTGKLDTMQNRSVLVGDYHRLSFSLRPFPCLSHKSYEDSERRTTAFFLRCSLHLRNLIRSLQTAWMKESLMARKRVRSLSIENSLLRTVRRSSQHQRVLCGKNDINSSMSVRAIIGDRVEVVRTRGNFLFLYQVWRRQRERHLSTPFSQT